MRQLQLFLLLFMLAGLNTIQAQTVQLPSFRFFATSTTVVVPDQGRAVIGGNTSAFSGSHSRSIPGLGRLPFAAPLTNNRGIAAGGSTGSVSVSAFVHDHEAMDTALLGMPVAEFQQQALAQQSRASTQSRPTLAEQQRMLATEQAAKQSQAEVNFELARVAYQQGKINLAQTYLRIAKRNASGELLQRIELAQARLGQTTSASVATK